MDNSQTKIIIAGFGGQGVVVAGNILARASLAEDKHVTGMVSYGAEMRGGTANSTIVISDDEIASPIVETPDIAIILNQPSLEKFQTRIADSGLLIINSSMVSGEVQRDDLDVVEVPATEIASQLGNIRVANIAVLGAFIEKTNLLKAQSILQAIEDLFSKKKPGLVEINKNAFREGAGNSQPGKH